MVIVHIDIETRSPINLRDTGASRYFEDFEILIVCWAVGDGAVQQWLPCIDRTMPADLRALFDDPAVRFVAPNAAFEWGAFTAVGLQTPLEKWRCTQVLALALALPHHLAGLSEALKLGDEGKMKDGSRLIQKFSRPKKGADREYNDWVSHPEDFKLFARYCEYDVRAERRAHQILSRYDVPSWLWGQWVANRRINGRGLPLDLPPWRCWIAARSGRRPRTGQGVPQRHRKGLKDTHTEKSRRLQDWATCDKK